MSIQAIESKCKKLYCGGKKGHCWSEGSLEALYHSSMWKLQHYFFYLCPCNIFGTFGISVREYFAFIDYFKSFSVLLSPAVIATFSWNQNISFKLKIILYIGPESDHSWPCHELTDWLSPSWSNTWLMWVWWKYQLKNCWWQLTARQQLDNGYAMQWQFPTNGFIF